MLTISGVGSGIDIDNMVNDLMKIKRKPLNNMQNQQLQCKAQISAYGQLKNAVDNFQTSMSKLSQASSFQIYKTETSDSLSMTATANSNASSGIYNVVINKLAQAHKLSSIAFNDKQTSLEISGSLQIDVNSKYFTIDIDNNNNSLEGIKNAINNAEDNQIVKATILSVDDGVGGTEYRLVLTAENTGSNNTIILSDVSGNATTTLNISNELTAAQDASIQIDGFNVTSPSNIVENVMDGVTININKENPENTQLIISRDIEAVSQSAQEFVDSYNALLDSIDHYSNKDLKKENNLNHMKSQLVKKLITETNELGKYALLSEIGITTSSENGHLVLDTTQIEASLSKNFNDISNLFIDQDQGYATRLHELADKFLDHDGFINIRESGLNNRVKYLDNSIMHEQNRLEKVEANLKKRFAVMDEIVSRLRSTSEYLTNQLESFPTLGGNKQ